MRLLTTTRIRDADALVPGFYWAASRDLNVEGDWRGSDLYADYGDGYVKIASSDIPAVVGGCTTTLGTVTDVSAQDLVQSVTFTLQYGDPPPSPAPFSTVTFDDLLANPYRNLFLIGNEYLQAETVVDNGSQSYTISKLLRGRFGTDTSELTHSASERVVFLDGSEKFVPVNISILGHAYNYKAVTINQDVADATAVPFTWMGGNLRPLAVANPRGTRDSGDDLLVEFEGRTRFGGGLRSYQAGAVNEEVEEYRVQILNSGSTTLPNGRERIMTVIPGMQQAAVVHSSSGFTDVSHNTFGPSSTYLSAKTFQSIPGPANILDATLIFDPIPESLGIGLQATGGNWTTFGTEVQDAANDLLVGSTTVAGATLATMPYLVILQALTAFGLRMWIFEYGSKLFSVSSKTGEPDYDPDFGWGGVINAGYLFKLRFAFVGSSVRILKQHTQQTPFTTIVTGQRAAEFPMFGVLAAAGLIDNIAGVTLTTYPFPKTIYSANQQTEDGFTPGDPVQMDIWQHSPVVGPGSKRRVTL